MIVAILLLGVLPRHSPLPPSERVLEEGGPDRGMELYTAGISKHGHSPSRVSSKYNRTDVYAAEFDNQGKYSPKGVSEFESTNTYKHAKCDSRKEVQSRPVTPVRSSQASDDGTRTNLYSLFSDEEGPLIFEDDTFPDSGASPSVFTADHGESNFDAVTLGSPALETGGPTIESYLTSPDDGAVSSFSFALPKASAAPDDDDRTVQSSGSRFHGDYGDRGNHNERDADATTVGSATLEEGRAPFSSLFEPANDGPRQRQPRRRGPGRTARTSSPRSGSATAASASDSDSDNLAHGFADVCGASACGFLVPEMPEAITESCKGAKAAWLGVLHAFFASPDDVGRVADRIRDTRFEMVAACHERRSLGCHGERCA